MDYDLTRVDYIITGITYPDTLKVLPVTTAKSQQKFVVGDKNGVLQCLGIRDEEPVVQFKTLPGKPITSVQLGCASGLQTDKIFAAIGNEVKGYTRKGKVFLTIETSVSETITSMCVVGGDLILCSGRTVTFYSDLREMNSYVCEDRVLDMAVFATPNSTRIRLLALVANKGAVLLENGRLIAHATISSGPSRLAVPPTHQSNETHAFYGAVDGCIGLIVYQDSVFTTKCLMEGRGLGSVVCMGWFFSIGGAHLAIGRHDGSIQLYLIDLENINEKPRLKFTYFCGEPVTSVAGGSIGSEENELLASTFSGRIFALRSRRHASGSLAMANIPQEALASRRSKLETEIARLEKQTANEREKYQRSTRSLNTGLSAPPLLDILCELTGAKEDGWQEARITSAVPLDMLFVYCSRKLDMKTDSAAVLSICSSQNAMGGSWIPEWTGMYGPNVFSNIVEKYLALRQKVFSGFVDLEKAFYRVERKGTNQDLLATVRCQAGTRRLWVRMRYEVGTSMRISESVSVLIYALPAGAPRVARLLVVRMPLLPYYSQHENQDVANELRSWAEVSVTGSFSVAEMTSWLTEVLPGELPRPSNNIAFARSHTLLKTILLCQYRRGNAVFKTDNISTLAVIRDIMSNCSVAKNIRVEITYDIPSDCCLKSFIRLQEYFEKEYNKHKDLFIKKALRSLDLDDKAVNDEEPTLCEDYRHIWNTVDEDNTNSNFEELVETIKQWFADWQELSLHLKDYNNRKNLLQNALKSCQLGKIKEILANKPLI